jgi:hypothetical protein
LRPVADRALARRCAGRRQCLFLLVSLKIRGGALGGRRLSRADHATILPVRSRGSPRGRREIMCPEKLILRAVSMRKSWCSPTAEIFFFLFFRNRGLMHASRLDERGVARDRHDTRGGDAMDVWVA